MIGKHKQKNKIKGDVAYYIAGYTRGTYCKNLLKGLHKKKNHNKVVSEFFKEIKKQEAEKFREITNALLRETSQEKRTQEIRQGR